MRLAYIADGRSPIALSWIEHFVQAGHEVHLLSTFPCTPNLALASLQVIPVAFSGVRPPSAATGGSGKPSGLFGAGGIGLRTMLRHWLGPWTLPRAARAAREALDRIRPDLVHAMRVPFEGMLAAAADPAAPLLISVWGNDFTLHAPATPFMRAATRRALRRADGLHSDCRRDQRLAMAWGLQADRPAEVVPTNGGVRGDIFHPRKGDEPPGQIGLPGGGNIPPGSPVVVNPRGFRHYVRNDTFFRAIPRILHAVADVWFVCPSMAGESAALRWCSSLGIAHRVLLLPPLSARGMAEIFRRAQVSISPSEHDGTPNTLLEAMACGCLPVLGDLESVREWVEHGNNGLLVDPASPSSVAAGTIQALQDPGLRARAAERNRSLIVERATYAAGMAKAERLYEQVIRQAGSVGFSPA